MSLRNMTKVIVRALGHQEFSVSNAICYVDSNNHFDSQECAGIPDVWIHRPNIRLYS